MTTYDKWRFRSGVAFALFVGFLFGGIVGAIGTLPWMAGSSILTVVASFMFILWGRSIVA